ncbi:hypothetical protein CVT91_05735 [Candidatus Atribacteria bacterium HGW-Atribacteria-1]|nr:MAG: hypothetical protein CVT91_05735 [Candidatus Atribacteria bacterium HGW-Atribacteria-1]
MQVTLANWRASFRRMQNAFLEWLRYEKQLRAFRQEFQEYQRQNTNGSFLLSEKNLYPCLNDRTEQTLVEPTYFYQDAWAFEKIVKQHPQQHVDVGSHHKFVALLSKVLPVTMVDLRPLSLPLDTLKFKKGSILELPFENGCVESLSSLCVVEHIGLGRYGDPIDPNGSEKAIHELKRIVQPGGSLYLSLPLDDKNRIYFNAHRAFKEEYVLKLFEPFQIVECRYIYGQNFGDRHKQGFGIGCYHLRCRQ